MKRLHSIVLTLFVVSILAAGCGGVDVVKGLNVAPPPLPTQPAATPTPTLEVPVAAGATVSVPTVASSLTEGMPALAQTTVAVVVVTPVTIETVPTVPPPPVEATLAPAPAVVEPAATAPISPAVSTAPKTDLAATVNGEVILKKDYQKQVKLARTALESRGQDLKSEEGKKVFETIRRQVLEDMINLVLMQQAATGQGINVTQKAVEAAAEKSIKEGGGRAGFEKWLKDTGQTEADYKEMIQAQLITEAIGDKVTGKLPEKAAQVHARHILLDTEEKAQQVLKEVKAGKDFAALAKKYSLDQSTKDKGGDLGWFPRNMLPPEIDDAAFKLEAGQTSEIIKDSFGSFHIIQVLEKDPARALTKDQSHALGMAAFGRWIAEQRLGAKIERFIEFKDEGVTTQK